MAGFPPSYPPTLLLNLLPLGPGSNRLRIKLSLFLTSCRPSSGVCVCLPSSSPYLGPSPGPTFPSELSLLMLSPVH